MYSVILVSVFEIVIDSTDTSRSNALFGYILFAIANPSLLSIIGARLLYNMKEAGAKGLNEGTSCDSKSTISDIEFGAPPEAAASQFHDDATGTGITGIGEIY